MKIDRLFHEVRMYTLATLYVMLLVAMIVGGAWLVMLVAQSYPLTFIVGVAAVVLAGIVYVVRQGMSK